MLKRLQNLVFLLWLTINITWGTFFRYLVLKFLNMCILGYFLDSELLYYSQKTWSISGKSYYSFIFTLWHEYMLYIIYACIYTHTYRRLNNIIIVMDCYCCIFNNYLLASFLLLPSFWFWLLSCYNTCQQVVLNQVVY